MNAAANGIWQRNPALAWREIDEETVIISPGESVMHELNDTGSFLWRHVDGRRTAEDLAALFVEQYDVTPRPRWRTPWSCWKSCPRANCLSPRNHRWEAQRVEQQRTDRGHALDGPADCTDRAQAPSPWIFRGGRDHRFPVAG